MNIYERRPPRAAFKKFYSGVETERQKRLDISKVVVCQKYNSKEEIIKTVPTQLPIIV